jgi:hypothetical protein
MTIPIEAQVSQPTPTWMIYHPALLLHPYTLTVTITDTHDGTAQAQVPFIMENVSPSILEDGDAFSLWGDSVQRVVRFPIRERYLGRYGRLRR